MRITARITSLLVLLCTTHTAAQISSLEPGDRVRLQLDSKEQLTGEFVSATDDSLTLRIHADATATTLPITAVWSLEVSRGMPSAWRSAPTPPSSAPASRARSWRRGKEPTAVNWANMLAGAPAWVESRGSRWARSSARSAGPRCHCRTDPPATRRIGSASPPWQSPDVGAR